MSKRALLPSRPVTLSSPAISQNRSQPLFLHSTYDHPNDCTLSAITFSSFTTRFGLFGSHSSRVSALRCSISRDHRVGCFDLYRGISTRTSEMAGQIIDGTAIAKKIRGQIHAQIRNAQKSNPQYRPCLKIIQIGDRPDSSIYVRMKLKAAEEVDVLCELIHLSSSTTEPEVLLQIHKLNSDPSVHGILVQLPVPDHISKHAITSAVSEEKDVDGFGAVNIGELAKRGGKPLFVPCTPKGVMMLLQESGVDVGGANAVVLGRSDIVGGPVSYLLKNADATVTVCHSRTRDLPAIIKMADIVIAAIGKPRFVKGEWLKEGAIVIDVGTSYVPDPSKKSGRRLVGDVDFDSAIQVASQITPVPGGVGPMTIAMLLQNVVDATTAYFDKQKARRVVPLHDFVPSDNAISRSQPPKVVHSGIHKVHARSCPQL